MPGVESIGLRWKGLPKLLSCLEVCLHEMTAYYYLRMSSLSFKHQLRSISHRYCH